MNETMSHDYAWSKSWIEFKAPNAQGVYWLRNKEGRTLFVGKGNVDERTREIGLRRAVGARRRHIRAQFLAEALTITLAGGLLGMAFSALLAAAIGTIPLLGPLFKDTSGQGDIHLQISLATLALSTGILVLVGVLSGLAPAVHASRLDPCEALRRE